MSEWSCPNCVIRATPIAPQGRVVASCSTCLPLHERTPKTHPNTLERSECVDDEASPEARARFQKMLGDLLTVQSSLSGLSQYAGSPGDLAYLRERLSHAQEDLMIFVFGPRWDAEEREKRTAAEHAAKLEKDLCYVGRRG